jgi:drug/metabolite transporter (DMT)-like permease
MIVFFYVLKHLPVTVALSSVYLLPLFGLLLAMVLLNERPDGVSIAGGAVVLVSTILIMKYDPSVA